MTISSNRSCFLTRGSRRRCLRRRKEQPVYWIWDELTELPFEQWKLHIELETGFSRGKAVEQPLIVVFQSAITTRTNV